MWKHPTALALDLDGVFYEQTQAHLIEWRRASIRAVTWLAEHRRPTPAEYDRLLEVAKQGYEQHGSSLHFLKSHFNLEAYPQTNQALFARVHEEFDITTLPCDPALADRLQLFGLENIAVVTNGSALHARRALDRIVGRRTRDRLQIYALDTTGADKGQSALGFLLGIRSINRTPAETLVVEDSAKYLSHAARAGFQCALVGTNERRTHSDLHAVLDALNVPSALCGLQTPHTPQRPQTLQRWSIG